MQDETTSKPKRDRRADVVAVGVLLLLTALVGWHRWVFDDWLSRHDLLAFFIPWYGYLGDRLAAGDVPGWNPYLFGGTPMAGDPESGWMYFPAMLTFTVFPVLVAMKSLVIVQLLIAGTATYAFGRALGFGAVAALLSAVVYEFGPFLYTQTDCCTVASHLSTWIPVALLGVELSLRARRWVFRAAWWSLAGLAISQMLAGWVGQGALNGILITGAWVGYRTLVVPPDVSWPWRRRLTEALLTGPTVLIVGLGISAAGLLPRLAVNAQSNNPGGTYEGVPGAYDESPLELWMLLHRFITSGDAFRATSLGGAVVVLALLAPLVARKQFGVPFFLGLTAIMMALSLETSFIHRLFYLWIPMFEEMHSHGVRRILWIAPIGPAMLAGATFQALKGFRPRRSQSLWLAAPLLLVLLADPILEPFEFQIGVWPKITAAFATLVVVLVLFVVPRIRWQKMRAAATPVLLGATIALIFAVPNVGDIARSLNDPNGLTQPNNLWQHRESVGAAVQTNVWRRDTGGAGEFLRQQGDLLQPFRYVGYSGRGYEPAPSHAYPTRRLEEPVMAILTNGRPFRLEVQTIQGYNPLQLGVWSDWMSELNRYAQNYHYTDLLPGGAQSPMLDMLNVRYIVIDASIPPDRADIVTMTAGRTEVFRNDRIVIYENPESYSRGWIVHDVRQAPGEEAMRLINDGQVNGRYTAFVEGELPPFQPLDPATSGRATGETANVTEYEADAMTFQTSARTDGFLVISEVYEEGWKAYVDGVETEIYQTNHALRGVPIPAGEHTVELRYESDELRYGMMISGVFIVGAIGVGTAAGFVGWRDRRPVGAGAGAAASRPQSGESRWRVPGALGRLRRRTGPLPDG